MTQTKTKLIEILIVDDHKMVRDGIRTMLESQEERISFSIEEAETGEVALDLVSKKEYDIVLMDQQLPGISGSEVVLKMVKLRPEIRVLAVSNYDEFAYISDMLKSGAKGYVLKNIGPDELFKAIETIMDGKNYYANDVAIKLINVNSIQQINSNNEKLNGLSSRELEVLKMIASELTNEEIAQKLSVAKRTVDSHRQNLLNKLKVKNTAGLINYVHKNKLI
jgi:DNA-binding NarL/FixJ family response regulator